MSSSDRNGSYMPYERSLGARWLPRCTLALKSAPDEKHEPVPVTTRQRRLAARGSALATRNASSSSPVMLLGLSGRFRLNPATPSEGENRPAGWDMDASLHRSI